MIIDRKLQLDLLHKMRKAYPQSYDFNQDYQYGTVEYKNAVENLYYLESHGLLEPKSIIEPVSIGTMKMPMEFGIAKLSHKGIDFLQNDGGLSSVLNLEVINLEYKILKNLLVSKIQSSELSSEYQETLIEAIQELSADALKHLVIKIIDTGYSNVGSLMKIIKTTVL